MLLVPSKYTVYANHLKPQGLSPPTTEPLARLTKALEAAGITTVNLTPPMKENAEEAWAKHELLHWRDDTHWNAAGIRVAKVMAPDGGT